MITTKLRVRTYPDPCLRKKSAPVKEVGPSERMLISAMIETMHEYKGIGLAAAQVGINEQIFVADIGDGPMAVINPRIVKRNGREAMEEGCLSIPGITMKITRPKKIAVHFLNEDNKNMRLECEGLLARVILHETDHLRGRLIIDYVPWRQKLKLRRKLKEMKGQKAEIASPEVAAKKD